MGITPGFVCTLEDSHGTGLARVSFLLADWNFPPFLFRCVNHSVMSGSL